MSLHNTNIQNKQYIPSKLRPKQAGSMDEEQHINTAAVQVKLASLATSAAETAQARTSAGARAKMDLATHAESLDASSTMDFQFDAGADDDDDDNDFTDGDSFCAASVDRQPDKTFLDSILVDEHPDRFNLLDGASPDGDEDDNDNDDDDDDDDNNNNNEGYELADSYSTINTFDSEGNINTSSNTMRHHRQTDETDTKHPPSNTSPSSSPTVESATKMLKAMSTDDGNNNNNNNNGVNISRGGRGQGANRGMGRGAGRDTGRGMGMERRVMMRTASVDVFNVDDSTSSESSSSPPTLGL